MNQRVSVAILIACLVFFAGTLYFLLKARFETGDVYPPSSSLRSDPLGTMIFFESLQRLPGLKVTRDHSPFNRLPQGQHTTYLHFAADRDSWSLMPADTFKTVEQFLFEGGRLVVTLSPDFAEVEKKKSKDDKKEESKSDKAPEKEEKKYNKAKNKSGEDDDPRSWVSLSDKWGLTFEVPPKNEKSPKERTVWNVSTLPLPKELPWHGDIILKDPDSSWNVIYKGEHGAVLAEKKRGQGSIVVATDSYFVSNEALVRDRQPDLLAWLVEPNKHIVFDEAHFGIVDSPGVASLARKYRLHAGVAALIILAALFIWKNSSSLAPARKPAGHASNVISGRTASAGFTALLRRNIPAGQILETCVEEWKKSFGRSTKFSPREKHAVEKILAAEIAKPARERNPVDAYRKIYEALQRHPSKPNA